MLKIFQKTLLSYHLLDEEIMDDVDRCHWTFVSTPYY